MKPASFATARISIHALREEGDHINRVSNDSGVEFLSTPSARRATSPADTERQSGTDFYPRPPRGGRLYGT